jgi:Na+-translocating ferredoxin:NAD+ oxidoreductase subunit B
MVPILIAVCVMAVLGGILGLLLGIANKVLHVESDPRELAIQALLPGLDCGACGHPGCLGMTQALLSGKELNLTACKPSKPEQRIAIQAYLLAHPGPDGKVVKVNA